MYIPNNSSSYKSAVFVIPRTVNTHAECNLIRPRNCLYLLHQLKYDILIIIILHSIGTTILKPLLPHKKQE